MLVTEEMITNWRKTGIWLMIEKQDKQSIFSIT